MPNYEYECGSCGGRFEVIQKFSDPAITVCSLCKAENVKKILSASSFVLKGGGWYVTDYPSESRKKAGESEKACKEESKPAVGCAKGACAAAGTCAAKG